MAPPQLGLYHLTLVGEVHGQRTQNGFWFVDMNTTPADSNAEAIAHLGNDFLTWAIDPIKLWASQDWHTVGLICKTYIPHEGPLVEIGPIVGGGAQPYAALPSYSAGVVAVDTGNSGRSHRGRNYFAGVSKDLSDGDFFTADSFAQLQAIGDAFNGRWGSFGSSSWHRWCVYSPKLGNVRHAGPPPWIEATFGGVSLVTATHARRAICTQRHRFTGKGI